MRRQWNFEFLSTIFIILLTFLIIYPIYVKCGNNYGFYVRNAVAIFVFLTLTKYIFLLKFTPYARLKWWRLVMTFLPIWLFFYHLDTLFNFKRYIDEEGLIAFFKGSTDLNDYNFGKYIRYEYMFFAVSALVTIALMPIRMIISFWRTVNTDDKV